MQNEVKDDSIEYLFAYTGRYIDFLPLGGEAECPRIISVVLEL